MDIHTFATHVAPHAGLGTVQLIGLAYVIAIAGLGTVQLIGLAYVIAIAAAV